jgi:TatD DNase family protein
MSHKWIDIGVNLTNSRFDKDRQLVIEQAESVGVVGQIVTGTNLQESLQANKLCQQYPKQLYATAGCHPHDAKNFAAEHLPQLRQLLAEDKVVAVGECGLDFNRDFSPRDTQLEVFERQLILATECNKPVFLHERDAFEQQIQLLTKYRDKICGAVVHCFTGSKDQLITYLDLDLHIGITGWICDERRGQELQQIVHLIPDSQLMLETDAPYLTPRNIRPRPKSSRNLPQYLPHIAAEVAAIRKTSLEHLSEQCFNNTTQFFKLELTQKD